LPHARREQHWHRWRSKQNRNRRTLASLRTPCPGVAPVMEPVHENRCEGKTAAVSRGGSRDERESLAGGVELPMKLDFPKAVAVRSDKATDRVAVIGRVVGRNTADVA
jgi:hypothetical protein